MASTKIYDLAVKVAEYTDREGKAKGRWQNVGCVMQTDEGGKFLMLARWFSPAGVPDLSGRGGESILVSMFTPKDPHQPGVSPSMAAEAPGFEFKDKGDPAPAPRPAAAKAVKQPVSSQSDIPF